MSVSCGQYGVNDCVEFRSRAARIARGSVVGAPNCRQAAAARILAASTPRTDNGNTVRTRATNLKRKIQVKTRPSDFSARHNSRLTDLDSALWPIHFFFKKNFGRQGAAFERCEQSVAVATRSENRLLRPWRSCARPFRSSALGPTQRRRSSNPRFRPEDPLCHDCRRAPDYRKQEGSFSRH